MRPSQKSNRARGRGNRKPNGSNINRVYESAGPEGKVRGTPQQIIDKYLSLARDAQTSGDRVVAENFLQHAEHYQRILIEAMGARQERRDGQSFDMDGADFDGQDDYGDGETEMPEPQPAPRPSMPQPRPQESFAPAERAPAERAPHQPEVSGLTTIDSGNGETGSLLVEAEELSASQPRRRRRGRRSGDGPAAEPGAEATPQPTASSD